MAITYVNVVKKNITEPLEKLLKEEFLLDVYWDRTYMARNSEYFNLKLLPDSLITLISPGQTREYPVEIRHYLERGGEFSRQRHLEISANIVERLKRLFASDNNMTYIPSGQIGWFNARIEEIDYEPDLTDEEEENGDLLVTSILWAANITEITG